MNRSAHSVTAGKLGEWYFSLPSRYEMQQNRHNLHHHKYVLLENNPFLICGALYFMFKI
jgi:hypothetical protein